MRNLRISLLCLIILGFALACSKHIKDTSEPPSQSFIPVNKEVAKALFNNFRKKMGYITANGMVKDTTHGYIDLSTKDLKTIMALANSIEQKNISGFRLYYGYSNEENVVYYMMSTIDNDGNEGTDYVATPQSNKKDSPPCPYQCDVRKTGLGDQ